MLTHTPGLICGLLLLWRVLILLRSPGGARLVLPCSLSGSTPRATGLSSLCFGLSANARGRALPRREITSRCSTSAPRLPVGGTADGSHADEKARSPDSISGKPSSQNSPHLFVHGLLLACLHELDTVSDIYVSACEYCAVFWQCCLQPLAAMPRIAEVAHWLPRRSGLLGAPGRPLPLGKVDS